MICIHCENNLEEMKYYDENTVLISESDVKFVEKLRNVKILD